MSTYNGWTNHATWRVNLELIDGLDPHEMGWTGLDAYDLAAALKDYVNDRLDDEARGHYGLLFGYATAFLADVNWREIAKMMLEAYEDA